MKRTEPPPRATWILEHCTPADRDEAIAGDLLEDFRFGRSDGWYWRQALSACAIGWLNYLRARASLLVFALLWSMPAPAWKMFSEKIESSPIFASTGLNVLGPLAGFIVWTVLNSTFFWAGIGIYTLSHKGMGRTLPAEKIRRACRLVPLIFLPAYGIVFVLVNLYEFYLFVGARFPPTLIGQVLDLGRLENTIRIPYIITMLCALWGAVPRLIRGSQSMLVDSPPIESSTPSHALPSESTLEPYTVKRFLGLMVIAGLVNAMLAGILLCRLPELQSPTLSALLLRAVLFVIIGVIAGLAGSWLYWNNPSSPFRERSPIPFPFFALVCTSGLIWVPSITVFSEESSPATAIVAAVGAVFLAAGLRYATFSIFAPALPRAGSYESEDTALFSQSLSRPPWEAQGYWIAFLLYAGGCALAMRLNLTAAALFALCAFLFVWKRIIVTGCEFEGTREYKRAALRLASVALPAILVTFWALLDGVAPRNRIADGNAAAGASRGSSTNEAAHQKTNSKSAAYGFGGYESLILWPIPEKKQIVPPLPEISVLAPGTTQPLIIPFSGQYWYMQPPNKIPGPTAHQAHGTPLGAEIASINFTPLVMDAHQTLGTAVPIARCREIQVEIENRDNRIGLIAMAVLLTDAASPHNPTLYLGQQPIVSTEHFSYKSGSIFETLRFSIPASAKIRRFDEITVMMLPDVEHALVGPKIAVKQFQLFPR